MTNQSTRGFTLIELMVVVAIIGMVSSIVLSSIASARAKAGDASVKSNLKGLTNSVGLYATSNGNSYGATFTAAACPTSGSTMFYVDTSIRNTIARMKLDGGGVARCASDGINYAVSAQLKTTTDHWCVDSSGASKQTSNESWTGVACP